MVPIGGMADASGCAWRSLFCQEGEVIFGDFVYLGLLVGDFYVRVISLFNACWCLLASELTISVFVRMSASSSSVSMVIFRFANLPLQ